MSRPWDPVGLRADYEEWVLRSEPYARDICVVSDFPSYQVTVTFKLPWWMPRKQARLRRVRRYIAMQRPLNVLVHVKLKEKV